MSSFYVGYLPQAPDDLRRFLRRFVARAFAVAASLAVLLVLAQQKFSPAVFEYATVRDFEGTLLVAPYPLLLVPDSAAGTGKRYLLVGVGKHGFVERLDALRGRTVHIKAKRIYRDEGEMLEVMPGSISEVAATPAPAAEPASLGAITLTGEIVDSKCFLGVMNPGRGKVHRDCAARCISGGVPPLLLVQQGGRRGLYSLATADGKALDASDVLPYMGEQVRVTGDLFKSDTVFTLRNSRFTRAN